MNDGKPQSLVEIAEVIDDLVLESTNMPTNMSTFREKDRIWYDMYKEHKGKWDRYIVECRTSQEDMIFKDSKYRKLRDKEENLFQERDALEGKAEHEKLSNEEEQLLHNLHNEYQVAVKKREERYDYLEKPYKQEKAKISKPEGLDPKDWLSLPMFYASKDIALARETHGLKDDERVDFDKELGTLTKFIKLTIIHDKELGSPTIEKINNGIWPEEIGFAADFWEKIQNEWSQSEETRAEIRRNIKAVRRDLTAISKSKSAAGVKRRGRKPLKRSEAGKRQKILEGWKQANQSHISRVDFCDDKNITVDYLEKCQAWERQRANRDGG